ncbi:Cation efflux protein [Trinorchestia longiramus]|nr:Cation efflux protein [Trinorchestia longiramus]
MSLNADDVTLNNNVIPPNNNLNVTGDVEAEVQSQRIQNVYLLTTNGPRSVPESNDDAEHARNLPMPTYSAGKNLQSEDGKNLTSTGKENDSGSPAPKKFVASHPCSVSKTPLNKSRKEARSNRAVIKLWVVVVITLIHCGVLMVAEHLTHSLTLRVEAYHSLYNVGVLVGSLISIKLCQQPESLKNTFGWARIDVVLYLVSLIFLSSLCFSVAVEAAQTALHIHHQDPMHHPAAIIYVCCASLAVNAIVFFLIGGYTQHQGSFCELRGSGEVFINKQVKEDSLQRGQRTLSARNQKTSPPTGCPDRATRRQGYRDVLRDITGILLALLCAVVVFFHPDSLVSYYLDSLLAVCSVTVLMWLSYPFGKECSNILLQTIPDHIDVSKFSETLQKSFPDVLNVHHLHIWSLRPGQVVATVHMIFANKGVYQKNSDALTNFFQQQQISLVTLQPEFIVAEMATLPYCRCVDHLLDEAEDVCDDFAMSHLDIHYHLHGDHHHHHHEEHHEEHHHHHHEHEYHHNHNKEHVYYNENLHHHEVDPDYVPQDNERIQCDTNDQRDQRHLEQHQLHGHIHNEKPHIHDENEAASDFLKNKSEDEQQEGVGNLNHRHEDQPLREDGSCHASDVYHKDGTDHFNDGSKNHTTVMNIALKNKSKLENVHQQRISKKPGSKIKSTKENNGSELNEELRNGDQGKTRNMQSESEIPGARIENEDREGKKSLEDTSTERQYKEINDKYSQSTESRVKSSFLPKALSSEKKSIASLSEEECKINCNSGDHQRQSPQTSCSDLDNEEDLSYSYHKTSSEKRKSLEDGVLLLSRDHPKTKEDDNKQIPQVEKKLTVSQ